MKTRDVQTGLRLIVSRLRDVVRCQGRTAFLLTLGFVLTVAFGELFRGYAAAHWLRPRPALDDGLGAFVRLLIVANATLLFALTSVALAFFFKGLQKAPTWELLTYGALCSSPLVVLTLFSL
jgi:hypothetical protein